MTTQPQLRLGAEFTIPIDAVTQTFAIVGKRGRGKTSTAKVLVEEMVTAGQQVIVMDTVGAWWGIRSSLDGKKAGLPVVVFGGMHGDVDIEDTAGELIARTLMQHRVPAVIDLSGFRKAGQRRFATAFIEELYHSNREPLHVVFDEADEFAPQTPFPEARALLGAMEDFVRRGRLRGLGATLVSQRPAVIHKDVLTQVEVLITLGLTGPRDVAAIDEWVKLHADEGQAREVRTSLASLPTGTAWVWSPEWLEVLQKVQVRRIRTFDSSATPKVGSPVVTPTARATIDLDALGAEIAATVQRQKEEDPKALRKRIVELERQLATSSSKREDPVTVEVEIPVPSVTDEDRRLIDQLVSRLAEVAGGARSASVELSESVEAAGAVAARLEAVSRGRAAPASQARPVPPTPSPSRPPRVGNAAAAAVTPPGEDAKLSKMQKAILQVLATHGTLSTQQIGLFTKYAHKSGHFSNTMSALRSRGLIVGGNNAVEMTDVGAGALELNGGYEPLPSGRELVSWWLRELPKAQAAILSELVTVWPGSLSMRELGERTGYAHESGNFSNARSKLSVADLIRGDRSALYAADTLGEAWNS